MNLEAIMFFISNISFFGSFVWYVYPTLKKWYLKELNESRYIPTAFR